MKVLFSNVVSSAALMAGLLVAPTMAVAQEKPKENSELDDAAAREIVVTGTFIRGVAAVGANVVGLDADAVVKTGASDSTQLLAKIPQLGSFSQLPTAIGTVAGVIRPPLIRDLPTLILFDGQRVVPVGLLASDPNVNAIPPSIIERVDVIPGGGSALYGSDAVGGVINFVPMKNLQGFKFLAHGGVGDHYDTRGADLALGAGWDTGHITLAYSYDHHSNLAGRDRSWFTTDTLGTGLISTVCDPGTVFVGSQPYRMPNLTPGSNVCNTNAFNDLYPNYDRHSVYAAIRQDLGDAAQFDLSAFYAHESFKSFGAAFFGDSNRDIIPTSGGTITSANPYFRSITGETTQTFSQNILTAGLPYNLGGNSNQYQTMGVTPKVTVNLTGNWRAVASFNYGRSEVRTRTNVINATALASALASSSTATAYNPYNPSSNSDAVLKAIFGTVSDLSHGIQQFHQSRLVVDGSLFSLPAGEAKIAVGYEHLYSKIQSGTRNGVAPDSAIVLNQRSRNVDSFFGELSLPLVGGANAMPGIERLGLSAALRHDRYSDGFNSTNPRVGVTYVPTNGLNIRASWGKSFHAPDMAYLTGATNVFVAPAFVFPLPPPNGPSGNPNQPIFLLAGANPGNLKPESATSWELGFDLSPPSIPGLKVSATYFAVNYKDKIDYPPVFTPSVLAVPYYLLNPTLSQLQAATAGLTYAGPPLANFYTGTPDTYPYAVVRGYPQNQASVTQRGIDFDLRYSGETGFGAWRVGVAGSHYFTYKTFQVGSAGPLSNLAEGQPAWLVQASTGVTVGKFDADVRVDHRASAPVSNPLLPKVAAFTTTNVVLGYDFGALGPAKTAKISLNIDNAFNVSPPRQFGNLGVAFTNLGRVATLSINTTF